MERGTSEEERVLRERWAAMECEYRAATRLLRGLTLGFVGAVLVLVGAGGFTRPPCYRVEFPLTCTAVQPGTALAAVLVAVGAAAVGYGTALAWRSVTRDRPLYII